MARPSTYTPETVAAICQRLSTGEPMAVICRSDGMPSYSAVWDWMNAHAEVREAIARARDIGADTIAEELRSVARGGAGSSGDVQRDKLIIETDLKLLSKWNPKKYGDKITQEHTGADGGPIAVVEVVFVRPIEQPASRAVAAKITREIQ